MQRRKHIEWRGAQRTACMSRFVAAALAFATIGYGDTVLIDFGNNSSFRGVSVSAPDENGRYWNSVWSGAFYANMVNAANQATAVDFGFDSATGTDSFNGPAGATSIPPTSGEIANTAFNTVALEELGATNAVFDYYINSSFQIQGLEPNLTYTLTFFGSHKFSTDSATTYTLYTDNSYVTEVASVNLNVQNPGNASLHNQDAVAELINVSPQPNGTIYVKFLGANGNNGYLNAMKIEWEKLVSSINGITASQSVPYGSTSVALSGTVSAPGLVYPADGETVAVTINGVTQYATVAGGAGAFSLSYPVSAITAGVYTITYVYTGNALLNGTTNTTTSLTISTLTPTMGVKASQSAVVGTSSVTLTGLVSAAGPVYPANGSTVAVTINGVTQNASISGGAGAFAINYAVASLPVGVYPITYSFAGNATTLGGITNTATTLTIKPDYQVVLLDFGNNSSFRGVSVAVPDENGRYWNSVWSGAFYANMVNAANQATAVDFGFDSATGTDSFNGPAGATSIPPTSGEIANTAFNAVALEELGATNAVFDYFINSNFQIQGLEPNLTYRLTFYGAFKFGTDAATTYSLHADNTYGAALASVNLNVRNPSNASQHNQDTVALLNAVSPQPDGKFYVKFRGANGNNGYLNAMKIEWEKATSAISGVPASQSVEFGTANVTLSGSVSAPGPVYPVDGETVTVTINGVTHNAAITGGAGAFTVNYPISALAVGTYPITYRYTGNTVLNGVTNNVTSLTVSPAIYSITVDFGRHDGVNGNAALGQDIFGRYWNNISSQVGVNSVSNGTAIAGLVTAGNNPTPVGLRITSGGWASNGRLNGGLLSPSSALLGNLAVTNATEDYFFIATQGVTETFRISGLNPDRTYNLRFFGTRESAQTRVTTYTAGGNSVALTTSGTGIGSGGYSGNNDEIVALNNVAANGSGQIDVSVTATTALGYLGILEITDSLGFCLNNTPVSIAPVANQTVFATGSANLSFNVVASDGEGCVAPALTAYGLPIGASFNVSDSGHEATGSFSWTPTVGQVGTYPVRFVAQDSNESGETDIVVLIRVGVNGEGDIGGVPDSQVGWHVDIMDLNVPSSGNATLVWDSAANMSYDVYESTQPIGGGASWSKVVNAQIASGVQATSVLSASGSRYFQVVPKGTAAGTNGIWGVVRPTIGSAFHLMAPPLVGDRRFDGALGAALIASGMNDGTQIHIITGPSPNWQTLELSGGQWLTEPGGTLYSTPLLEGQGYIVQGGSGAQPVFSGSVGNIGESQHELSVGYNLIGLSEGRVISVNAAFASITPVASYNETQADQVILQNANGSWRRLVRLPTGVWFDMSSGVSSSITLTPGQAYYYIRRSSNATVEF